MSAKAPVLCMFVSVSMSNNEQFLVSLGLKTPVLRSQAVKHRGPDTCPYYAGTWSICGLHDSTLGKLQHSSVRLKVP